MPALFVNASYRHGLSCKNKNNNNKKNYKYQPSVWNSAQNMSAKKQIDKSWLWN